jgi:hypothetical protein
LGLQFPPAEEIDVKRLALFLMVIGTALFPGPASAATTYDWVAGYGRSDTANPSGPWSYMQTVGTSSTDPADLVLFPTFTVAYGWDVWTTEGPEGEFRYPNVYANSTNGYLHPGNDSPAVLRWTAPSAGTVQITGAAGDVNALCGNGVNWSLNHDRVVLDSGSIANGGPNQSFGVSGLDVAAGDSLYFIVDANGQQDCDSTSLDFTVTVTVDADKDGVEDLGDNCPDVPNPGQENTGVGEDDIGDACDDDADNDGVVDGEDNCPNAANTDQANLDQPSGDTEGDVCDGDIDGDGTANEADAFDFDATEDTDTDGDGIGDNSDPYPTVDARDDADNDGVANGTDNCPTIANGGQADLDGDGIGDACDGDRDGDGVANGIDNAPDDANADQKDLDGDGIGDVIDSTVLPTSASQCKKDGWMRYYDGGARFKNQGDCVSFVATGGRNLPAGS